VPLVIEILAKIIGDHFYGTPCIFFILHKQHTAIQIQTINIGLHKKTKRKVYTTVKMLPHTMLNLTDTERIKLLHGIFFPK